MKKYTDPVALAAASGIQCPDDGLIVVCQELIRQGSGTVEEVREAWAEATEDWAAELAAELERES